MEGVHLKVLSTPWIHFPHFIITALCNMQGNLRCITNQMATQAKMLCFVHSFHSFTYNLVGVKHKKVLL